MKFTHSFDKFLKDTVNLDMTRVTRAQDAVEILTSFLKNAEATKNLFIDTAPQGSLRQGTIIRPRKDDTDFDVDLLLYAKQVPEWTPKAYLEAVHKAFKASERYKDLVDRRGKHRCVTIEYVGDFHVDIVPSIEYQGNRFIMNRETDRYEVTDGDGYAEWFRTRNERTGGAQLVRVVRLLKYLRDEHGWPVKSILLTTLVGRQVLDTDTPATYPDVPTSLKLLLGRLDAWLEKQASIPDVFNPVLTEEKFTRHWDEATFQTFKKQVRTITERANDAYGEANADTSGEKWQRVFGEEFPIVDEDLEAGPAIAAATLTLGTAAHAQPLATIAPNGEKLSATVRVDGWVYDITGKRKFRGINSDAKIGSGYALRFKASTNAREPYDVHWQVVNTGSHAASVANGLRGEFFKGHDLKKNKTNGLETWETSLYTGKHWIECFIVKDGVCVGRNRFYINIKNPAY